MGFASPPILLLLLFSLIKKSTKSSPRAEAAAVGIWAKGEVVADSDMAPTGVGGEVLEWCLGQYLRPQKISDSWSTAAAAVGTWVMGEVVADSDMGPTGVGGEVLEWCLGQCHTVFIVWWHLCYHLWGGGANPPTNSEILEAEEGSYVTCFIYIYIYIYIYTPNFSTILST